MSSIVKVVFDNTNEFSIVAHATCTREEAVAWLDDQWEAFECESTNPTGKVLMFDKILTVAKYAGEKRFAEPGEWAENFARAVVSVLGRPAVRVDIAQRIVG